MEETMKRRLFGTSLRALVVSALLICAGYTLAQELEPVTLPPPQRTGGMPLLEALSLRQTLRSFSDAKLPPQVLSNLLWAAFGVNRPEGQGPRGKVGRTAPSGMNMQEIDLYVAMPEGVYLYEAVPHRLTPVLAKDVRPVAARRPEWAKAPLVLIYVADTEKRPAPRPAGPPPGAPNAPQPPSGIAPAPAPPSPPAAPQPPPSNFGEVDGGFIGQNVYLYCASAGLATCFHGTDREGLAKVMNLRESLRVLYAQTVGYPVKVTK
jgi:nitroreductase